MGTRPKASKRQVNLTEMFIRNVQSDDSRTLYWDEKQKGLALSVEASGTKSFKFIYSIHGNVRWYHIADVRAIGVKMARDFTRQLYAKVIQGIDVQAEKTVKRKAGTFDELARRYIEEHAKPKLKSWDQSQYKIEAYLLPEWKRKQAQDIKRGDVKAMFNAISARGSKAAANQALAQAKTIFKWALREEVANITLNPCEGIELNATKAGERYLSDTEIPVFWNEIETCHLIRSRALRMILLTGQRPGEVSCMRWADLDIGEHQMTDQNGRESEYEGAWWTLEGEPSRDGTWPGVKNKQTHRVWLSGPAMTILNEVEVEKVGYVFPSSRGNPVGGIGKIMIDLCEQQGMESARPHDLRRTHGTLITGMGFTRDQMNRIQNHKAGGIADVYDRFGYQDESRHIQETVASRIMGLVSEQPDEKVVPLVKRPVPR
jgi:integrase